MKDHTTSLSTPVERSSKLGSFLSGFGSGAFNGALMLGIFSGVVFTLGKLGIAGLSMMTAGPIAATILATGLFSGVMAVKRALSEGNGHSAGKDHGQTTVLVPAVTQSIAPSVSMDKAESVDTAPTQSWAERVGQSNGTQSRVDQILANGSMSDKDRAAAILQSRENAQNNAASIV